MVVLNIFVIVIVLIALAGTKGKLDTVELMLKDWQKQQHFKGVPRKRKEEITESKCDLAPINHTYPCEYEYGCATCPHNSHMVG